MVQIDEAMRFIFAKPLKQSDIITIIIVIFNTISNDFKLFVNLFLVAISSLISSKPNTDKYILNKEQIIVNIVVNFFTNTQTKYIHQIIFT